MGVELPYVDDSGTPNRSHTLLVMNPAALATASALASGDPKDTAIEAALSSQTVQDVVRAGLNIDSSGAAVLAEAANSLTILGLTSLTLSSNTLTLEYLDISGGSSTLTVDLSSLSGSGGTGLTAEQQSLLTDLDNTNVYSIGDLQLSGNDLSFGIVNQDGIQTLTVDLSSLAGSGGSLTQAQTDLLTTLLANNVALNPQSFALSGTTLSFQYIDQEGTTHTLSADIANIKNLKDGTTTIPDPTAADYGNTVYVVDGGLVVCDRRAHQTTVPVVTWATYEDGSDYRGTSYSELANPASGEYFWSNSINFWADAVETSPGSGAYYWRYGFFTPDNRSVSIDGTTYTANWIGVYNNEEEANLYASAVGDVAAYRHNVHIVTAISNTSTTTYSYHWKHIGSLPPVVTQAEITDGTGTDPRLFSVSAVASVVDEETEQSDWTETNTASSAFIQNKPTIPTFPLGTANIANDAITAAKIAANAVGSSEIGNNAVGSSEIQPNAVGNSELASGAVTGPKIQGSSVVTSKIQDGAVTGAKIASGAVTTAKIGTGAVNTGHIADGAVSALKIGAGQVTTPNLGSASVTHDKLADNAVENDNIANRSINLGHIQQGLAGTFIGFDKTTGLPGYEDPPHPYPSGYTTWGHRLPVLEYTSPIRLHTSANPITFWVEALEFGPGDTPTLYGANTRGVLYEIDQTAYTASALGGTEFTTGEDLVGMALHNGTMWMISRRGRFYSVNLDTGAHTEINSNRHLNADYEGLVSHNGNLYTWDIARDHLYTINHNNGDNTLVGSDAFQLPGRNEDGGNMYSLISYNDHLIGITTHGQINIFDLANHVLTSPDVDLTSTTFTTTGNTDYRIRDCTTAPIANSTDVTLLMAGVDNAPLGTAIGGSTLSIPKQGIWNLYKNTDLYPEDPFVESTYRNASNNAVTVATARTRTYEVATRKFIGGPILDSSEGDDPIDGVTWEGSITRSNVDTHAGEYQTFTASGAAKTNTLANSTFRLAVGKWRLHIIVNSRNLRNISGPAMALVKVESGSDDNILFHRSNEFASGSALGIDQDDKMVDYYTPIFSVDDASNQYYIIWGIHRGSDDAGEHFDSSNNLDRRYNAQVTFERWG